MPERFIKPILIVIAIAMLVWILFWMVFSTAKKKKGLKITIETELTYFLFYIYAIAVMSLTIIPLPFTRFEAQNQGGINIIPVVNIIKALVELFYTDKIIAKEHTVENLVGNIILFIPLGVFLPLLSGKYRSVKRVVILACACSVSIELSQLILRQFEIYRTVDIDDVILNTSGAFLGFRMIYKFRFKRGEIY